MANKWGFNYNIVMRSSNGFQFTVVTGRGSDGKYQRQLKTYNHHKKIELTPKGEVPKRIRNEIESEYLKYRNEILNGTFIPTSKSQKMTFENFVNIWWDQKATKKNKSTTLRNHQSRLNNGLLNKFGNMYLDQISFNDITVYLNGLAEERELSKGTIKGHLATLKSIFKYAILHQKINNPTIGIEIENDKKEDQNKGKNELNVFDFAQWQKVMTALESESLLFQTIINLAIDTGCRKGEIAGIEWKHIDFEEGTIHIEQTYSSSKNGLPVITEPKTKNGTRTLSLMNKTLSLLKQYRDEQNQSRQVIPFKKRDREGKRDFVFRKSNGLPFHHDRFYIWWTNFLTKNNFGDYTFHDIRHTMASHHLESGTSLEALSKKLGHSSFSITVDTYQHLTLEANREISRKMEEIYNSKKYS